MQNILTLFLFLVITRPVTAGLSLDEAQKIAVSSSLEITSKRELVRAAEFSYAATESRFYPELEAKAGFQRNTSELAKRDWFATIVARYNLFRGWQDVGLKTKASLESIGAEIALDKERIRLRSDVAKIFYNYQLHRGKEKLLQRAIDTNLSHRKLAEKAKESGQLSSTDVSEFDLRKAVLQSRLLEAKQEQELLINTYRIIINEPKTVEFSDINLHVHLSDNLETLQKKAMANNLEIRTLDNFRKQATAETKSTRGAWFPSVDFEAEYGFLPLDAENIPHNQVDTQYRIVASWPLFNGGTTLNSFRSASHREKAAYYSQKYRTKWLRGKIEIMLQRLSTLEKQHHLAEDREYKGTIHYQAVKKEYLRGYRNSADLADASESLVEAELKSLQLEVRYLLELVEIESLVGEPVKFVTIKNKG